MLYDPKWDTKVKTAKPDVFSLASLIAWLEQQDASEQFSYTDITDCPLARYFRAHGYRGARCGVKSFTYFSWWRFWWPMQQGPIPYEFNKVVACSRTYGEVLQRARELHAAGAT